MAHHGMSRHHRFGRLARRRNHSEPCNGENTWQDHNNLVILTTPESSNGIGVPESEVERDNGEDSVPHDDTDLSIFRRQQNSVSSELPTKVTAVVSLTDSFAQPPVSSTDDAPSSALSQTSIPAISLVPPSISTDSGFLTLSPHVPDPTLFPTPSQTAESDAPASTTSNNLASTAPTASTTPAVSSQSSPTSSSTGTITSTSLISRLSSTQTPTTTSSSSRVSSTSTSSSSSSSSSSSTSTSTDTSSTTDSAYTSFFTVTATTTDSSGYLSGYPTAGGLGTAATATGPSSTATNPPPPSSGPSPTTNKIVGGVVGSVAGVAFLFLVLLLWLRRRHAALREARQGLPSGDVAGGAAGEGSVSRSAEMTSRQSSHDPLFSASYFTPAFMMRHWRKSNQTTGTDSTLTSNPSERGFQKIAGRKIPSVLQSGGDGYGGGFGEAAPTGTEMSVSFQPTPPINIRPPTSQPPTATPYGMPLDTNYTRENPESEPRPIIRPSPARTPTASSTNIPSSAAATPPRSTPEPQNILSPSIPKRPDALGRSHPSLDGSRGSRFTESI